MAITRAELEARIEAGHPPAILDVRSTREFADGHIPGATHVPFWDVVAGAIVASTPDQEIVVYCGHGPRAYLAGSALRRRGFKSVAYLTGHMKNWRSMKFPVEIG